MKLPEMRQMLSERGIQLTKSLGQNFLHEEKVIAKIAAAGELTKSDKVLEVGPGLGPLTELLLAQAGEVLAIEMDARLVEILRLRFQAQGSADDPACSPGFSRSPAAGEDSGPAKAGTTNLQLLHADALKYLETTPRDWRGWKLVSNMPYSVASPILVELALAEHGPERMVATLQLEVAKRLKAQANDEDYGLLTLLVQLNYEPRAMFRISAGCFFPQPNVDSACLTLVRRSQPLLTPAQTKIFVRIVKQAFSQRRKMMAKLLRADWPEEKLLRAMGELNLSPQIRAEAVTLKQFVELTKQLCANEAATR
ncbi:MAG: rRNA ((1518)-N(6)/adenine(1519)-N(6))-dimethyltransferase RsmA [Verrucomicrobiota bacterium]|jgi:16S rRNA (adenine1518-N6/adenine1519-N6)-dimethyltransferase